MWPQAERRRAPSGYVATLEPAKRRAGRDAVMRRARVPRPRRSRGGGALLLGARALDGAAGAPAPAHRREQSSGSSNLFDMNQGAARRVVRSAEGRRAPSLTDDERDALEHQIRCQCGCTLDVYICRTTDFSCQVSPAMHRDVIALVEGGYSAQEIIDAFVDTYGERALMAPKREGLQLGGLPRAVRRAGGGRRGGRDRAAAACSGARHASRRRAGAPARAPPLGTADELARLDAAVRRDD